MIKKISLVKFVIFARLGKIGLNEGETLSNIIVKSFIFRNISRQNGSQQEPLDLISFRARQSIFARSLM